MAQIFVSHSQKDVKIKNFFGVLFGTTQVKGVFKEIEEFSSPDASREIEDDIRNSAAIFVLLGENVNKLHHTRDWVVWESALARPMRKDIWVFEPYKSLGKIDVIIPHVDHYVIYREEKEFNGLIRAIIDSYDDSKVLPTTIGGTVGGAAGGGALGALIESGLSNGKAPSFWGPLLGIITGAVVGGLAGASYSDPSKNRPEGLLITCHKCRQTYRIHTKIAKIRCPCCNTILVVFEKLLENSLI